ncbi:nodulation protein NfeD [Pyrobaculum sp.]|uniref:NfeD family protein n=1 Tax=Pyrobaculum sp. TaxID=2004705 RepID=UPI003176FC07
MRIAILLLLVAFSYAYVATSVYVVEINGVVGPYTYSQIQRAISLAEQNNGLVLILLSTPGGLADPTLQIIREIGNSPVPVVGYVYPDYSYAWSAGTYILLSTHIAAMAPHTVIGSCQPISGGTPVNESKILNALIGYLETVSKSYGRNGTFARLCITQNINLDAETALKYRVIDVVATGVDDLLKKINGMTVLLRNQQTELVVESPVIRRVEPSLTETLQMWLSDPVMSSVLSLLAFLLLLAAFITGHPAAAVAAIVLLVISMFSILPTAWLGLALIIMGAVLILAEILMGMAAHGAVAGVGAVLLVVGFLSAYPANVFSGELIHIRDWWLIQLGLYINIAILLGFLVFIVYKAVIIHKQRPPSEILTTLKGAEGVAVDDIGPGSPGFVIVFGEYWRAVSDTPVKKGCRIRVVEIAGEILKIEPVQC